MCLISPLELSCKTKNTYKIMRYSKKTSMFYPVYGHVVQSKFKPGVKYTAKSNKWICDRYPASFHAITNKKIVEEERRYFVQRGVTKIVICKVRLSGTIYKDDCERGFVAGTQMEILEIIK